MPFSNNSKNLPSYVKKLSPKLKTKWIAIFNATFEKEGEKMAFIVANKWLKRQTDRKPEHQAKSLHTRKIIFEIDDSGEYIKKDLDGQDYVSFRLADTGFDNHGESYSPELLQKWANEINEGKVIVGDFNHEEYDLITATTGNNDLIGQKLKEKRGIATGLKAVFEKGVLWVKALIDKRYKRQIQKTKGVSLEAFVSKWDSKDTTALDGRLDGFSFMFNNPANPRSVVTAA